MLLPFLAGTLMLRAHHYAQDQNSGAYLLLSVMALVWCADSGAYFTGRFLGKTPMLPRVSPEKNHGRSCRWYFNCTYRYDDFCALWFIWRLW